ncbi:MAG: hypothetical protein ACI89U_000226 [Gammaproteobacteria bacterium]|jgi:hypothetical protein
MRVVSNGELIGAYANRLSRYRERFGKAMEIYDGVLVVALLEFARVGVAHVENTH